ncbi:MAG: hypothetical protein WA192_08915, partial [Candidatus Acidiferrales bacterium]
MGQIEPQPNHFHYQSARRERGSLKSFNYTRLEMPANLTRYHNTGNFHFITFSCYKRSPLLAQREGYSTFEHQLET